MFDELLPVLRKHPEARVENGPDFVRIRPCTPEGFEAAIEQIWETHFSVSYDHWHEDFYNLQEAEEWFFLGLSNHCRLKVQCKDAVPFRWTAEYWEDPNWLERSTVAAWTYRLLSPTTTSYLQNNLLTESDLSPFVDKVGVRIPQAKGK